MSGLQSLKFLFRKCPFFEDRKSVGHGALTLFFLHYFNYDKIDYVKRHFSRQDFSSVPQYPFDRSHPINAWRLHPAFLPLAPITLLVTDNNTATGTFASAYPRDSFLEQAPCQGTFNIPGDYILSRCPQNRVRKLLIVSPAGKPFICKNSHCNNDITKCYT